MRSLTFTFDADTGAWASHCGDRVYARVLDFAAMGPGDGFAPKWTDMEFTRHEFYSGSPLTRLPTKKCPHAIKNAHRQHWGLPPLPFRSGELLHLALAADGLPGPVPAHPSRKEMVILRRRSGITGPLRYRGERITARWWDSHGRQHRYFLGWGLRGFQPDDARQHRPRFVRLPRQGASPCA